MHPFHLIEQQPGLVAKVDQELLLLFGLCGL